MIPSRVCSEARLLAWVFLCITLFLGGVVGWMAHSVWLPL